MSRKLQPILCLFFLAFLASWRLIHAEEVQRHGVVWEQWVRDTFFDGYKPPSYTQKWDIPKEANTHHGGVPVNPKATKYKTPIDLGDALRQIQIDEPFILVVGYWKQEGDNKRWVNVIAPRVEPKVWRELWGPVTLEDLQKLDALIKDRSLSVPEVRKRAQEMKKQAPFSKSLITLNPKIDTHGQRRLQCSLRFKLVFEKLAPDADDGEQAAPLLWGVPVPVPWASKPRGQ